MIKKKVAGFSHEKMGLPPQVKGPSFSPNRALLRLNPALNTPLSLLKHRRSQGVHWVHVHPQRQKKLGA